VSTERQPAAEQLDALNDVIRRVARGGRLRPADAEDFSQSVHVKLLERNYDVFARFDGRSSLRTYLTVVVTRLLLDWRNAAQGKWRRSAIAARLGTAAVALERLIYRDSHHPSEAIQLLRSRGCMESTVELRELSERIPARPKRTMVSDEVLSRVYVTRFEDPLDAEQRRRQRQRAAAALAGLVRELPTEDRWLLRVRYQETQPIQEVARALHVKPRILYRRIERILRALRRSVASADPVEMPISKPAGRREATSGRACS
jgi:RNA polymerase sigma factor (sigma-70 family)